MIGDLIKEVGINAARDNYIALKMFDAAFKYSLSAEVGNDMFDKGKFFYDKKKDAYHCIVPFDDSTNHLRFTKDGFICFEVNLEGRDDTGYDSEIKPCRRLLDLIPKVVNHFAKRVYVLELALVGEYTSEKRQGDLEYLAMEFNSFRITRVLQITNGSLTIDDLAFTEVTENNLLSFLEKHGGNINNIEVE